MIVQDHPFTRTLGFGPYIFKGLIEITFDVIHGARINYTKFIGNKDRIVAGVGTCAHCSMGILNCYMLETANGDVYGVGSDCINKLQLPAKELSKAQKMERERQKKLRAVRKAFKGQSARDQLRALKEEGGLREYPHPGPFHASQGKTLHDYVEWALENSSDGGVVRILKIVLNTVTGTRC